MALPSLSQAKGPGQARGRAQQVPESTQGLEQLQGWGTAVGSAPPQQPSWCMARKAGPSSPALAAGAQVQASSGRGMPCWDPNTPGSQWQGCLPTVPGVRQCRTQELAGPASSLDEHLVAECTHEHCLLLSLWGWKGKQKSDPPFPPRARDPSHRAASRAANSSLLCPEPGCAGHVLSTLPTRAKANAWAHRTGGSRGSSLHLSTHPWLPSQPWGL